MKQDTALFNIDNVDKELAKKTIDDVYKALSERGYNPTAQIVVTWLVEIQDIFLVIKKQD